MTSMWILFADAALFILLTWYFDIVLESNRGRGDSPFFPFIKIWKKFMKKEERVRAIPSGE